MAAYTEVTSTSWVSRIGGAFKGILLGLILFLGAFVLLFWNEGRAVKTAKGLEEGAGAVISVSAAEVDPNNEGKLVHMTGLATTDEVLSDPLFPVSAKGIKLVRTVEMYQWKENSKTEKRKKIGGGEETVTTYTYEKVWSATYHNSSAFKDPEATTKYQNPSMTYQSETVQAQNVKLGAYSLTSGLAGRISTATPLPVSGEADLEKLPSELLFKAKIHNGSYYIGYQPSSPQVGDYRISFEVVKPTTVSVISQQKGNSFTPYVTKTKTQINMLREGEHTAESMFEAAKAANKTLTWILRVVGFFVMFIGLRMVFAPISVVLDVLPFLGNIAASGLSLISGILAFIFTLITIAVAWLFYRPLIGGILLAVAVGGIFLLLKVRKKEPSGDYEGEYAAPAPEAPSAPTAPPPPPPGE